MGMPLGSGSRASFVVRRPDDLGPDLLDPKRLEGFLRARSARSVVRGTARLHPTSTSIIPPVAHSSHPPDMVKSIYRSPTALMGWVDEGYPGTWHDWWEKVKRNNNL
jgi:hypothetical protein